jgi:predicted metal-binding membrane protein
MMAAMMLPSLVPMLWRYRGATGGAWRDGLTALVGLGYLFVWLLAGMLVYTLGLVLAAIELQIELHSPALAGALPVAAGLLVLGAGVLQFTPWKAHHLARCRAAPRGPAASGGAPAGI